MIRRTDSNQAEIIKAARALGASVVSLSTVGNGVPDLLIGYRGQNILCEVKTETGKLRGTQSQFISTWHGQTTMVHNIDELLQLLEEL